MNKVKIGIMGATGYTGLELIRLLERHSQVEIDWLTSESHAGGMLSKSANVLKDYPLISLEAALQRNSTDLVFVCLPHTAAMDAVTQLLAKGIKVIDLSADFRLKDPALYERWYGHRHSAPQFLGQAVYGLSEVYRASIRRSSLIANPGCFPTSVLLPLIPLMRAGVVSNEIIIDSKSSISGAGRAAKASNLFCEVNESFYPYSIGYKHRHLAEMEEQLQLAGCMQPELIFSPHVLPVNRGILSTIYIKSQITAERVLECWRDLYSAERFIKVLELNLYPTLAMCSKTNYCIFGVTQGREDRLIITSAIDNLMKGAAGQAVQNMNILFDYPEETALY
jgi:N-acetyl-gamma-glutamyl-phosphate reductase